MAKQAELNTIFINDTEYIRADQTIAEQITINYTGEETLDSMFIGRPYICRSNNAGLNAGIVEMADETGVILKNVRRLWGHRPKDRNLSWYEGVVLSGLSDCSVVSGTIPRKIIVEGYELCPLSTDIYNSIMEKTPNVQSYPIKGAGNGAGNGAGAGAGSGFGKGKGTTHGAGAGHGYEAGGGIGTGDGSGSGCENGCGD